MGQITELLAAVGRGDAGAGDSFFETVYETLRSIAHSVRRHESARCGLQTTELVNEAYTRLFDSEPATWENRRHFFGSAARAMRRILVEDARNRRRIKRGGGRVPVPLSDQIAGQNGEAIDMLALDEALKLMEAEAPRRAEIVQLRYFTGLSVDETAALLGIAPRTVDNHWRLARAWLHARLSGEQTHDPNGAAAESGECDLARH